MKRQSGQATIEFILTAAFSMTFLFLFINLAMSMTTGYVAHYATFSASRVFLVSDNGSNNVNTAYSSAKAQAQKVISAFPLEALGAKGAQFQTNAINGAGGGNATTFYQYVGAWLLFKQAMTAFASSSEVSFLSESFLGKEPTRSECHCQMQVATGVGSCSDTFDSQLGVDVTLFDNGC